MGKPTKECVKDNSANGPAFCRTCSEIIEDYVVWEGHTEREAKLLQNLEPYLKAGFRWADVD